MERAEPCYSKYSLKPQYTAETKQEETKMLRIVENVDVSVSVFLNFFLDVNDFPPIFVIF